QITATSSLNASKYDIVYDNTTIISFPPSGKSLHLHPGSTMDTFPGSVDSSVGVNAGGTVQWTQTPSFAGIFIINGDAYITLYAARTTGQIATATITLYAGATVLGTETITVNEVNPHPYQITITPSLSTIPAGESLILEYTSTTKTRIWFDGPSYDSRIDMATDSYVNVDTITLYNTTAQTGEFSSSEQISFVAVVSDPLGAQDISGAFLTVRYPDGTLLIDEQSMPLEATDPGNLWGRYNHTINLPADAPVGSYIVEITGLESNGVEHLKTFLFSIKCNVTIEPNNSGFGYEATTVSYLHWINNTGKGADVYNILSSSSQGWNVSVYDGGTLMAYDSNGDGTWDYVNPAYDTDGDGNPDTGLVLMGGSFPLTVTIDIPAGASGTDVTAITVSNKKGTCTDSATDTTVVAEIPEFSSTMVPMLAALIIFWSVGRTGKRRPERAKKGHTKQGMQEHSPNHAPSSGARRRYENDGRTNDHAR
ncbi:MAG: hypothetical protein KAT70_04655, partial [Thermoplasmata archaeon]|nr:hypothetical protein [Thermoplasmata archaeon]